MSWSSYLSFLAFAAVLVLVPGPDFAVVVKNTVAADKRRGVWSAVGVTTSNAVQGVAAAAGLGAVIVRVEPLFQTIKWGGIAYLVFLGMQSFRSAWNGRYTLEATTCVSGGSLRGWRQGFLTNITNPKVLVFYLAVLPQFLSPHASVAAICVYALSHALLSLLYLVGLAAGIDGARRILARRAVRRGLDFATGTALVGFGAKLALDHG